MKRKSKNSELLEQTFDSEKFVEQSLTIPITDMNVTPTRQNIKDHHYDATFDEINLLSRSYISWVQNQTTNKLRLRKMLENFLFSRGLLERKEKIIEKPTGERVRSVKYIKPPFDNESAEQAYDHKLKLATEELYHRQAYKIMRKSIGDVDKAKNRMLFESSSIYAGTELWDWCMRTEGLGEVAAITFMGFINPRKTVKNPITGESHFVEVNNVWSYAALTPEAKLRKGIQGNSNTLLKGRIRGVVVPNLILHSDPYYYQIYLIKKDYYKNRPDLMAIRDGLATKKPIIKFIEGRKVRLEQFHMLSPDDEGFQEVRKGWVAWMDSLARFNLSKIITSHAFQIIKESIGMEFPLEKFIHGNPLPIKPKQTGTDAEYANILKTILDGYKANLTTLLGTFKDVWDRDVTVTKEKYHHFMKHGTEY